MNCLTEQSLMLHRSIDDDDGSHGATDTTNSVLWESSSG
jgi:hypothetical protein